MKGFLVKLSIFSFFVAAGGYCWNTFMPAYAIGAMWAVFAFFVLVTLVFHVLTMKFAEGDPQRFVRYYMASTAVRMLLSVTLILVYRFIDKEGVIPFAMAFMAHYFAFTIFEVGQLLKELKK